METYPLVSILLPAYNAQSFIHESIESIVNQTYENWELLVCDDASTDQTLEIIEMNCYNDPRIKIFRNSSNLKLLKTRNKLLEIAIGDLITFQDADDYSDSVRLEKMVCEFNRNPNLGLLSSQVGFINVRGDLLHSSTKPTNYKAVMDLIYRDNVVGGSIMMIRKEALQSVGGKFRDYFDRLSYQDYDLSFLVAERYECYSLPEILYYYRQHNSSSSKIISVDRLLAKDVVIYLAKQRKSRGSDDLMDGHPEKIDAYFDLLRRPYREDPSLVFREFAAAFMYSELYKKAIRASFLAVAKRPVKLVNWRTLQYCVRKGMFGGMYRPTN